MYNVCVTVFNSKYASHIELLNVMFYRSADDQTPGAGVQVNGD